MFKLLDSKVLHRLPGMCDFPVPLMDYYIIDLTRIIIFNKPYLKSRIARIKAMVPIPKIIDLYHVFFKFNFFI
jgi:hypothetical protein